MKGRNEITHEEMRLETTMLKMLEALTTKVDQINLVFVLKLPLTWSPGDYSIHAFTVNFL